MAYYKKQNYDNYFPFKCYNTGSNITLKWKIIKRYVNKK